MSGIISIIGIALGVIFLIVGKKKGNVKVLKIIGILIVLLSLVIAAPDFISGFREGFIAGYNS